MKRFSTFVLIGTLLSAGPAIAATYGTSADTVTYRAQSNVDTRASYQPTTTLNTGVNAGVNTGVNTGINTGVNANINADTTTMQTPVYNNNTTTGQVAARTNLHTPVGDSQAMSGGTSSEGRAILKGMEGDYNTKLVFTGKNGAYVANVGVDVMDSSGNTVIERTTDGPILLMNLPQGRYTVSANAEGFNEKQTITVGSSAGLKTQHMRFPVGDDDYATPSW